MRTLRFFSILFFGLFLFTTTLCFSAQVIPLTPREQRQVAAAVQATRARWVRLTPPKSEALAKAIFAEEMAHSGFQKVELFTKAPHVVDGLWVTFKDRILDATTPAMKKAREARIGNSLPVAQPLQIFEGATQ